MVIKNIENTFSGGVQGYNASVSKEKRTFVVEKYFERKSCIAVQAAFRQQFNHTPPCQKTIQQNIKKYSSHGTSLNRNKKNSGRPKRVRSMLENNPRNISARRNDVVLSSN